MADNNGQPCKYEIKYVLRWVFNDERFNSTQRHARRKKTKPNRRNQLSRFLFLNCSHRHTHVIRTRFNTDFFLVIIIYCLYVWFGLRFIFSLVRFLGTRETRVNCQHCWVFFSRTSWFCSFTKQSTILHLFCLFNSRFFALFCRRLGLWCYFSFLNDQIFSTTRFCHWISSFRTDSYGSTQNS